jgi:hypothetical protein
MITPSFNLTATERVLPKLALDFTTATLDSRVTFTRTTGASNPATYVNSGGIITAATNNQPRFDYDPVTFACKGLLIEEARANSCPYSQAFDDVSWLKPRSSISADAATSPDGAVTADKLVEDSTASNTHYMFRDISGLSTTTYTYSLYAKAAERTQVSIRADQGTPTFSIFNLSTGTVVTQATGHTASIVNAGNGWYRCIVSLAITAGTGKLGQGLAVNGSTSYTGDGTSGAYMWGAQLEAGAFATSYIPTTTTALTRNADVATITGTNFSDFWQATKGGASVLATPSTVSGIRPLVQFDDNTANEIIALRGNTTNPELYIVDGGAPQVQLDAGTIVANTLYSLTGWWQTNDCKARQNSGATVSDYTATIPTVTQARLGSDGTNYLNGHLATINYYDRFTGQIYDRRKNKAVFSLL